MCLRVLLFQSLACLAMAAASDRTLDGSFATLTKWQEEKIALLQLQTKRLVHTEEWKRWHLDHQQEQLAGAYGASASSASAAPPRSASELRAEMMRKHWEWLNCSFSEEKQTNWGRLEYCASTMSANDFWVVCIRELFNRWNLQSIWDLQLPGYSQTGLVRKNNLSLVMETTDGRPGSWKERTAARLNVCRQSFWADVLSKTWPELKAFMEKHGAEPEEIPPQPPAEFFAYVQWENKELLDRALLYFYMSRSLKEIQPVWMSMPKHVAVVDGHLVMVSRQ